MKLVKIIREKLKLNPWKMHKLMSKKTLQAYLSLERKAARITLRDLELLEQAYIAGGFTTESFKALQDKCAKEEE